MLLAINMNFSRMLEKYSPNNERRGRAPIALLNNNGVIIKAAQRRLHHLKYNSK